MLYMKRKFGNDFDPQKFNQVPNQSVSQYNNTEISQNQVTSVSRIDEGDNSVFKHKSSRETLHTDNDFTPRRNSDHSTLVKQKKTDKIDRNAANSNL